MVSIKLQPICVRRLHSFGKAILINVWAESIQQVLNFTEWTLLLCLNQTATQTLFQKGVLPHGRLICYAVVPLGAYLLTQLNNRTEGAHNCCLGKFGIEIVKGSETPKTIYLLDEEGKATEQRKTVRSYLDKLQPTEVIRALIPYLLEVPTSVQQ